MTEELVKKETIPVKDLRYVEVRWLDAAAEASWTPIRGEDIVAARCITRGWVMREDKDQILICSTLGLSGDGEAEEANTIIAIPSPMIQSVTDFPPKPPKRISKKQAALAAALVKVSPDA